MTRLQYSPIIVKNCLSCNEFDTRNTGTRKYCSHKKIHNKRLKKPYSIPYWCPLMTIEAGIIKMKGVKDDI